MQIIQTFTGRFGGHLRDGGALAISGEDYSGGRSHMISW